MLLMLILVCEDKIHHLYQMNQKIQYYQNYLRNLLIQHYQQIRHYQNYLRTQMIQNLHKSILNCQKIQKIHFHYYHHMLNEHIQFAEMRNKL